MLKKLYALLAAFILILANSSYAASQEPVNLKWNFTEGQTFKLTGKMQFDASAEIPQAILIPPQMNEQQQALVGNSEPEKAVGTLVFDLLWNVTVTNVDEHGNADLQLELQDANINALGKIGAQQINYQMNLLEQINTPNGPQAVIPAENKVNHWKVAPNGKILAINGDDIDKTLGNLQQDLAKQGIQVDQSQVRQLTDMFFYFMAIYPSDPISSGDTWSRKADLSGLLQKGSNHDGVVVNNFHLLFQQNWRMKDNSETEVVLEEKSDAMPKFQLSLDGPEATVNITATGDGNSRVTADKANGIARMSQQNLNVSGLLEAQEKQGSGQEFQIPFSLQVKSDFKLTE